jgi:hypothetical protein
MTTNDKESGEQVEGKFHPDVPERAINRRSDAGKYRLQHKQLTDPGHPRCLRDSQPKPLIGGEGM